MVVVLTLYYALIIYMKGLYGGRTVISFYSAIDQPKFVCGYFNKLNQRVFSSLYTILQNIQDNWWDWPRFWHILISQEIGKASLQISHHLVSTKTCLTANHGTSMKYSRLQWFCTLHIPANRAYFVSKYLLPPE